MQPFWQYPQLFEPLTVTAPVVVPEQWGPIYPERVHRGGLLTAAQAALFFAGLPIAFPPSPDLAWHPVYPATVRSGGLRATYHPQPSLDPFPRPFLALQWAPLYPDRARGPRALHPALLPFTALVIQPPVPLSTAWAPLYADRVFRRPLTPAHLPYATYVPIWVNEVPVTLVFWAAGGDTVLRVTDDSTTTVAFDDSMPVFRFTAP